MQSGRHLTRQVIESLVAPITGNRIVYDARTKGFGIRITAQGIRSFVLTYRSRGVQRRITIGRYPDLSVTAAREQAIGMRGKIAVGVDPLGERQHQKATALSHRAAPTVAQVCERYLIEYAQVRKKPSSYREDSRLIASNIVPDLGKAKACDVSRTQISRLHQKMSNKPYEANRTLSLISKVFSLAELWGARPDGTNPCRHVRKYPECRRERFFNDEELRRVGEALVNCEEHPAIKAAIRLLALTGCRASEVLSLRWDFIDFERGQAHLPDAKAGARVVALTSPALAVLTEIGNAHRYVLTVDDNGTPLRYSLLDKAWRRIRSAANIDNARLHDFRHTVGTFGAQAGLNSFMLRDALGHKTVAMTAKYVERHADPLRIAVEPVAARIASAMRGHSAQIIRLEQQKETSR